jgi:hypothetical protein
MSERVEALIDALQRGQPADVSIGRSPGSIEVKVGSDPIARIDVGREELVVYAPADGRSRLLEEYRGASSDPAGVRFDLKDEAGAASGLALLKRRARVQRVGWQYRESSP